MVDRDDGSVRKFIQSKPVTASKELLICQRALLDVKDPFLDVQQYKRYTTIRFERLQMTNNAPVQRHTSNRNSAITLLLIGCTNTTTAVQNNWVNCIGIGTSVGEEDQKEQEEVVKKNQVKNNR